MIITCQKGLDTNENAQYVPHDWYVITKGLTFPFRDSSDRTKAIRQREVKSVDAAQAAVRGCSADLLKAG